MYGLSLVSQKYWDVYHQKVFCVFILQVWDEYLESSAQDLANACEFRYDRQERLGAYGQHIYLTSLAIDASAIVERWFNEGRYYSYETNWCSYMHSCGHYKQVIFWGGSRILITGMGVGVVCE